MDELDKDSHVQLDQIHTVDIEERIVDKYGTVSPSQVEKSRTLFTSRWGCNSPGAMTD
jgi:mRNA-degrading endonuclease toxin of MazEF toxin-antitoxin module